MVEEEAVFELEFEFKLVADEAFGVVIGKLHGFGVEVSLQGEGAAMTEDDLTGVGMLLNNLPGMSFADAVIERLNRVRRVMIIFICFTMKRSLAESMNLERVDF